MATEFVVLTEDEVAERSQTLAQKISEFDQLDAEKKEVAKEFKNKIDVINREIRELSNVVRSGKEYRQSKGLWSDTFED